MINIDIEPNLLDPIQYEGDMLVGMGFAEADEVELFQIDVKDIASIRHNKKPQDYPGDYLVIGENTEGPFEYYLIQFIIIKAH